MTIKAKKSKINLREKLAELLNFRQIRDRLDGLGLYLGKDRTGTSENLAVRGGANVDDLQLAEISAALGGTAVDVFVYDTRNDSDGGKWRERTSHTSWYNEELNTATRGSRREFPAVAVIVASSYTLTIYDGDDPDLSMWMKFTGEANSSNYLSATNPESCAAINGIVYTGGGVGSIEIRFISDDNRFRNTTRQYNKGNIAERNSAKGWVSTGGSDVLVNSNVNDVAMTVLPNAPIDSDTGLPIPTIAVATDGGMSVIRDDGTVVDITSTNVPTIYDIAFTDDYKVMYRTSDTSGEDNYIHVFEHEILSGDVNYTYPYSSSEPTAIDYAYNLLSLASNVDARALTTKGEEFTVGTVQNGAIQVYRGSTDFDKHMTAHITSSYNTGWMPGDIKLATLSDTKIEKVGANETELVSNGTFDSNTNDWSSPSSTTLSVDNQRLKLQGGGDPYPSAYTLVNVVEGIEYEVSAQYISNSNSFSGRIRVSSSSPLGGDIINGDIKTPGNNHIYRFTAPSTGSVYVALMLQDVNGNSSGIWDNVSVKQTGELITNGTFDNGTVGWTLGTGWSISGGVASNDGSLNKLTQTISTQVGKKYILSFDIAAHTTGYLRYHSSETGPIVINPPALQTYSTSFVATTDSTTITFDGNAGAFVGSIDNISVRLAEDDRSVNNNGLQIFGEITKSPVAPGADLVAYSGFSADDYLMQPYNSDLDFGTGDFCVMGWVNLNSSSSNRRILQRADAQILGSRFELTCLSSGEVQFGINDTSNLENIISSSLIDNNVWTFISCKNEGSTLYLYINGIQDATPIAHSVLTLDNSSALLSLGISSNTGNSLAGGSLALFRISATAPTDKQIAKIYRDEKVLFQDGAQATLYGTSDAVTALAYDDKTELLHVGTSGGRSDFAGLRRINNTTTAVTTSISASNNLIAEQ